MAALAVPLLDRRGREVLLANLLGAALRLREALLSVGKGRLRLRRSLTERGHSFVTSIILGLGLGLRLRLRLGLGLRH